MPELRVAGEPSPVIICLLGTARCGSTLLQRVIELNSDAIGLGEISRTRELLDRQYVCGCGEKLATCRFWAPALPALKRASPITAWSKARWSERAEIMRSAFAAMMSQSWLASRAEREARAPLRAHWRTWQKNPAPYLFIDSSKDPSEFLRLALIPSHLIVPVHLIRDPRAVAWSGFRRTGTDPIAMARHWARLNRAIAWLRRLSATYPWQTVRYEDFCARPRACQPRFACELRGARPTLGPQRPITPWAAAPDFPSIAAMPLPWTSAGKQRCRSHCRGI